VRYPRYEIVVVDNASRDDRTITTAQRHGARTVREDRIGLDNARNRGIAEARHDLIAYVDDDVQVDPEWLAALAGAFEDPEVDAVTGLVLPVEQETRAQRLFEAYGNGMSKGLEARTFRRAELTNDDLIAVQHIGVGANMAARRSALKAVGGFDPTLDVGTPSGGGGDLDMFHRLLVAGKTIRYEPSVLVRHRHRREMHELTRQLYDNGRAYGVYLLKLVRERTVPRLSVARYATWTWGRWLVGRTVLGIFGLHRLPVRLLWAELRGALASPGAFLSTHRAAQGWTTSSVVE
jgi:glycosyltransferase involved in cell wall biosynthesis